MDSNLRRRARHNSNDFKVVVALPALPTGCNLHPSARAVADLESNQLPYKGRQDGQKEKNAYVKVEHERKVLFWASKSAEIPHLSNDVLKAANAHLNSQKKSSYLLDIDCEALPTDADVSLLAEGEIVSAHRKVLADRSPIFKAQLTSELIDDAILMVDYFSHSIVEAVVNFCYSGEMTFSDTVQPAGVLAFAEVYKIRYVKAICDAALSVTVTLNNLSALSKLARDFSLGRLDTATKSFKRKVCSAERRF